MKQKFKYDTAINAILYVLIRLGGQIDMHKLSKILYFADQHHLSLYGRSITGDTYIAMQYGPVPSNVDDILKAVRGDSFFSNCIGDLRTKLKFENRFIVKALTEPDTDELSESDIECLNYASDLCKNKSFSELTAFSHGIAWASTARDRAISVKDILRETGDDESYVEYIADQIKAQNLFF
ncbi:MAG: SocA family protein [Duncaniella sp.]|nr:SocA family protein [Bacteroides sp.]MDE6061505.1 SocA family protein [Duncaniella sp.]MDE6429618.1 SocA family protein [Duncaniella sp.]MDE6824366.1 SocA family protein [Duncaniella sp.]